MRSAPDFERFRPDRQRLHPLFDGYAAAENRGTLALAYALNPAHSPGVLSSFAHAFLKPVFPVRRGDRIEARLQLVLSSRSRGSKAIPDAAFVNHSRKCLLLVESKVETGTLDIDQLRRHLTNAKRHYPGYRRVLLVVSPDRAATSASRLKRLRQPDVRILPVPWFDIHEWAWRHLRRATLGHRKSVTPTFLTRELIEFLRGRDWMGFQGFPADWPEEYRISEAREHLKALREHFHEQLRQKTHRWPAALLPTGKKLTQAWFPLGDGPVHLTVYALHDWTGVDLYVPHDVARQRLKSDEDWHTFLRSVGSLPERGRVWVKASRWRLMNWTQGRQTGPNTDSINLSISAEDLLSSKGKVLRDALRDLACAANTKALTIEYRHYFLDAKLQKQLRAREFADRLIRSAKALLDLYRWFGGTARRRLR